eukprot:4630236-Amphidinium_carterae.1
MAGSGHCCCSKGAREDSAHRGETMGHCALCITTWCARVRMRLQDNFDCYWRYLVQLAHEHLPRPVLTAASIPLELAMLKLASKNVQTPQVSLSDVLQDFSAGFAQLLEWRPCHNLT